MPRTPKVGRRGTWATGAAAMALVAAACGGGAGAGGDESVTIPSSDGSSPSITMDAHFKVEQRPFISVLNGSSPQQATVKPGEVVSFIANGTDTDGGVKTVQIWIEGPKTCTAPVGDAVSCPTPLQADRPITENPDPDENKKAGDAAAKSRLVTFNLSVPGGAGSFEAKVSAVVVNFNGETKRTPQVTITEPL